jgi:1-aminocyclopropane-1-carboxylate deaminase/D-cysteine desulfhydrase-like pyridoxal-dependent ACC family enzyme
VQPPKPSAGSTMTDHDALDRLARWPRRRFADLPTPLLRVDRLADHLGVPRAYVKMDAETGFALGGNKVRKLEFELAPDRLNGVTCLITAGGPQSNHCRVTAAAAARLGLRCMLVLNGPEPEHPTGNARLHRLFGAEIVTVQDRTLRDPTMEEAARRIADEGGRALILPLGASTGLGSLGYAVAAVELCEQLDRLDDGCTGSAVWLSSSSCGTLAGLILGLALLGRSDLRLVGVSADATAAQLRETSLALASEGAGLLGSWIQPERIRCETDDTQVGAGYGLPTEASRSATDAFARLEGIVLDPTYSSKAAAGMFASVGRGDIRTGERVVFLHTGGAPGLLA